MYNITPKNVSTASRNIKMSSGGPGSMVGFQTWEEFWGVFGISCSHVV